MSSEGSVRAHRSVARGERSTTYAWPRPALAEAADLAQAIADAAETNQAFGTSTVRTCRPITDFSIAR